MKALADALPNCAIHSETTEEETQDISFGGVTFSADITELNLSGMGLQNISALANCKNLTKLDLSGNQISDLWTPATSGRRRRRYRRSVSMSIKLPAG